jgi:hypothetical protein
VEVKHVELLAESGYLSELGVELHHRQIASRIGAAEERQRDGDRELSERRSDKQPVQHPGPAHPRAAARGRLNPLAQLAAQPRPRLGLIQPGPAGRIVGERRRPRPETFIRVVRGLRRFPR